MADEPTPDTPATGADDTTTTDEPPAKDDAPLGPAGQKALDAMKAEVKAAKAEAARAKALQKELDDLKSSTASEAEKALEAARKEGGAEATTKANARILRAEVKALAAGKLADPADAVALLDLTQFSVDDDGEVDAKAIGAALDELVKGKPYLAPSTSGPGSADGGARDRDDKAKRSTSLAGAVDNAITKQQQGT
jgi:hypothetical protein